MISLFAGLLANPDVSLSPIPFGALGTGEYVPVGTVPPPIVLPREFLVATTSEFSP
jgi:hypothetical protein